MKKITITLAILFSVTSFAQEEFLGTWVSDGTVYVMDIFKLNEEFKILNYSSTKELDLEDKIRFKIDYADEYINSYEKNILKTTVNNVNTRWVVDVVYTKKNKNKIIAEFYGKNYYEIITYKKKVNNKQ